MVKNPPANAGDAGLISGLGRSPGGGNDNPLQYSCLLESLFVPTYFGHINHENLLPGLASDISPWMIILRTDSENRWISLIFKNRVMQTSLGVES